MSCCGYAEQEMNNAGGAPRRQGRHHSDPKAEDCDRCCKGKGERQGIDASADNHTIVGVEGVAATNVDRSRRRRRAEARVEIVR
jgi:hypothetical protein